MTISYNKTTEAMHRNAGRHQSGIALVFALVVLVILTILGVSALRTSSLEQLMSGNTQEMTRALEAADSGLSRALNDIKTSTTSVDPTAFADGTQYTYQVTNPNGTDKTTTTATANKPVLKQIGPAVRSNKPSGSSACTAYYDQKVMGATGGTYARENLHQGMTAGAPCPQAP